MDSNNDSHQAHAEEEIRMLIAQSHKSGIINQVELALFGVEGAKTDFGAISPVNGKMT